MPCVLPSGWGMQRDAYDFMRFLFYFWFFAKIADIYFVWFYELMETRDLLILPVRFTFVQKVLGSFSAI